MTTTVRSTYEKAKYPQGWYRRIHNESHHPWPTNSIITKGLGQSPITPVPWNSSNFQPEIDVRDCPPPPLTSMSLQERREERWGFVQERWRVRGVCRWVNFGKCFTKKFGIKCFTNFYSLLVNGKDFQVWSNFTIKQTLKNAKKWKIFYKQTDGGLIT